PALFDQHHRCGRDDGFRERRDAKDRVAPHRIATAERLLADCVEVMVVTAGDDHHDSRELTLGDASRHRLVQGIEPGHYSELRPRLAEPMAAYIKDPGVVGSPPVSSSVFSPERIIGQPP